MNDIESDIEATLSSSPAVIAENVKNMKQEPVSTYSDRPGVSATNIRRHNPHRVEQINPESEGLTDDSSMFSSSFGEGNLAGVNTTRRPLDGSAGDPFFLNPTERYSEVAPFELYLPSLDKLVQLNTTSPDKAAYDTLRATKPLPEYDYLGYMRMDEPPSQNFISKAIPGLASVAGRLLMSVGRYPSLFYEMGLADSDPKVPDISSKDISGALANYYKKNPTTPAGVAAATKIADWWTRAEGSWDELVGYQPEASAGFLGQLGGGIGNGLGILAGMYLAPMPGPISSAIMNTAMSGPHMYYGQLEGGVSPAAARDNAILGSAAITAIDTLPMFGTSLIDRTERIGIKEFLDRSLKEGIKGERLIRSYAKSAGLRATAQAALGNFVTEPLQDQIEAEIALDATDLDSVLDERVISAVSGLVSAIPSYVPEVRYADRNARRQIMSDAMATGRFNPAINKFVEMVKPAIEDGLITEGDARVIGAIAVSPDMADHIEDRLRIAIEGQMSKVSPEQVKEFIKKIKDSGGQATAVTGRKLNELDAQVRSSVLDGGFAEADVPLFQALFRGLAAIKAYATNEEISAADIGEFFAVDRIPNKPKEVVGQYGPKDNDLYIVNKQSPEGKSDYDDFVVDATKIDGSLEERVRTILHEFSHKIDYLTGQTGFGKFLAYSFDAMQEMFGSQYAAAAFFGVKGRPEGKPAYTSYSRTTEWKAQAIERLGKNAAKYLGLSGSKAQAYLSYVNMITNSLNDTGLASKGVKEYQDTIRSIIQKNNGVLDELLNYYGKSALKAKIKMFLSDPSVSPEQVGLEVNDVLEIGRMLGSYFDAVGLSNLSSVLDFNDAESFVDKSNRLFEEGIELSNERSRQLRGIDNANNTEQQVDPFSNDEQGIREESLSDDGLLAKLYHGTPRVFDNISSDFVDSVGGTQYGWGLYVSEDKSTAKWHMLNMQDIWWNEDLANAPVIKGMILEIEDLIKPSETLLGERRWADQHPEVIKKLQAAYPDESKVWESNKSTGQTVYFDLADKYMSGRLASENLLKIGISANSIGENNYVIFDPESAKITNRVLGEEIRDFKISRHSDAEYALVDGKPFVPNKNKRKHKPQTLLDWYKNNNLGDRSNRLRELIKEQSGLRKRFPKFARFWGRLISGNTVQTLEWLGGDKLVKEFNIVDAERKWNNVRFEEQEKFDNTVREALGFNRVQMDVFHNDMARGRIDIVNSEGETQTLNGFEMMDVYLNNKQEYSKERNAKAFQNGQAAVDEVISQMTPDMIKYADAMQKTIESIRPLYEEALGMEFGKWENYWPVTDKLGQLLSSGRVRSDYIRDVQASGELVIRDAREKFNSYINKYAMAKSGYYNELSVLKATLLGTPTRFTNLSPAEVDLMSLMEKDAVENQLAIIKSIGKDGLDKFLAGLDSLMTAPSQDLPLFTKGVIGKAATAATVSRLVWAPLSMAKNATNLALNAGADPDGTASFWSGLGEALSNPKDAWEFMMRFPTIRNRFKGMTFNEFLTAANISSGVLVDIGNQIKNGQSTTSQVLSKLSGVFSSANKAGTIFLTSGDAIANVFGLYGYATKLMREYNSDSDAVDSALHDYIARTQSTNLRTIKSDFHRKLLSLPIVGQFTTFSSEPVVKFNRIAQSIAQAFTGETTFGEASRKILPIVISTIAFVMLSVGIGDLWDDDQKDDEDVYNALSNEAIQQVLSFTPIGPSILAPTISKLFGLSNSGINSPLTSMMGELAKSIHDKDAAKAAEYTATVFGGLYIDRFMNAVGGAVQAATADTSAEVNAGLRRTVGRTQSFAERREGIKRPRTRKKSVEEK